MKDMIVVIPGILGSTLVHEDRDIWGLSARAIIPGLFSLGKNLDILKLPDGIGHEDPQDGITPADLFPSSTIIPGFWNLIDGYTELVSFLTRSFDLVKPSAEHAGNLLTFPYDWRLSNQLNGQKLSRFVVPELERWQKETKNPDAKLIFICHSMGGLVARWFIEVMGGSELTRKLITMGTPYRGSVKALDFLSNGFDVGLGPLKARLGPILRSLPSFYQLLPTYKCIDDGNGNMSSLLDNHVSEVSASNIQEAMAFHDRVQAKVGTGYEYEIFALKGIVQPTYQSAQISSSQLTPLKSYAGENVAGDGTVPRPSAHPPEWKDDSRSVFFGQQHGSLQNNRDTLRQIYGILTESLGAFMGGDRIGLDIPDLIMAGAPMKVIVVSDSLDQTLPLTVHSVGEDGSASSPVLMSSNGDGTYAAQLKDMRPGAHRIIVSSAVATRPVDQVEGLTLVWDASLNGIAN